MKHTFLTLIVLFLGMPLFAQYSAQPIGNDPTIDELKDSLVTIRTEIIRLNNEMTKMRTLKTKVEIQIKRLEEKEKKESENEPLHIDSINSKYRFKYAFFEVEVFNKTYTKQFNFISKPFYCQTNDRKLMEEWKKAFSNLIYEQENLGTTFKDVRKSRVNSYSDIKERGMYIKLNDLKADRKKKGGNIRYVDFKPSCDTLETLFEIEKKEQE